MEFVLWVLEGAAQELWDRPGSQDVRLVRSPWIPFPIPADPEVLDTSGTASPAVLRSLFGPYLFIFPNPGVSQGF